MDMNRFYPVRSLRIRPFISLVLALVCSVSAVFFSAEPSMRAFADETEEEIAVDLTGESEGYSAALYNNTNGLPTAEANAIAETSEGFIWIGSYSGLIRYDGNTFERLDSTKGIASVVSLFVDSKDRLWVGTNDSGVAVMEKGEFHIYNKNDGLTSLSIRSIAEDSKGNIYVATTHGLAYIDTDMKLRNVDAPQINDEYIRMLRLGCDDTIYGVTMDNALFTIKNGKLSGFYNAKSLGIYDIHSVLPDMDNPGYVYIGNKRSDIYYGDLSSGFKNARSTNIAPLSYVNSITLVDDMIWLCSDKGIGYIKDGTFTKLNKLPMTTSVEGMMSDYQGNLWFVSSQQGVMKIVPNQFYDLFDKYNGLSEEVVYSTCMYNDMLFIGTKNSGLKILGKDSIVESFPIEKSYSPSGKESHYTDLAKMLSKVKIRSIVCDSKDRLWFSTFSEYGLILYDHGTVRVFTKENGLLSDRIRTVYECADGSFLVACTGGVAVIKDEKVTDFYDKNDGIANTEVLTVAEASGGDVIIGTDGDGIYILHGSNRTIHLGTEDGLSSDVIMRIKKDASRDIYWIVTSNSIAYMTADYEIHTIEHFPYSNNFDLYQNSGDEMWILSSNGIYVIPTQQLIDNGEDITPTYYGRDNGLSCITTSNSYSELTKSGDLYISGTTGVSKVNIEVPFEKVDNIKMAVPYVEADGKYIYPDSSGSFTIPAKTRKLTIHSYIYNYSLVNPQVTYRLDGFDSDETTLKRSDLTPLSFTNLKGGKYHFVMRISDVHGNSNKELKIRIIKKKTIFERIWFRVLCAMLFMLLIALGVMLYIRRRTKKFLKKQQEDKMLIREMVEAFAKVIDMKDKYTNGHSTRVADYTAMLARKLGCDDETVDKYYNIALLHDIGKVGVPPEVLNKPGKLTDTEFNIIKSHSALGYNTLKDISIMPELAIGAGAHHERPDGKGYPKGLSGDDIPRVAQIIAVADTFDAMYSDRPYRKRMNFDKAVSIMKEVRGTQLASDVVDAFLALVDEGEFRLPDDDGGGTFEDIDNIHKKQEAQKE